MRSIIYKTANLPATAAKLYEMYTDPSLHAMFTGSSVLIGEKQGSEFKAFEGALTGTILQTVPGRLVVQSWRSVSFHEGDLDSTLILNFSGDGRGGRIDLVHLDVPEHDYQGVAKGWDSHYFEPWKKFLSGDLD